ncbi:MAG: transporter substrate-binding domain-containing protein [Oscillospiraceae bacterium]|nr:transporter substrate-binding domain-containing protein [Oscillospiraceae bacterium]
MKPKRINSFLLVIAFILTLLAGCKSDNQDKSLQKILDNKVLKIGISDNNAPLSSRNEKGEFIGFDVELAQNLCKRLNVNSKFVPVSQDEAVEKLNSGLIDCYWSYSAPSREVMASAQFMDALYNHKQMLLLKSDSPVTELVGIKNTAVGVLRESAADEALTAAAVLKSSLKEVKQYDDFEHVLSALNDGVLSAVVIDNLFAKNFLYKDDTAHKYKLLETPISTQDYRIAFRQKDTTLKNRAAKILDEMVKDKSIAGLSLRWFNEDIFLKD